MLLSYIQCCTHHLSFHYGVRVVSSLPPSLPPSLSLPLSLSLSLSLSLPFSVHISLHYFLPTQHVTYLLVLASCMHCYPTHACTAGVK